MDENYAVVKISGVQYKIRKGEEILVNRLKKEPEIAVLLFVEQGKAKIGKPYLKDVLIKTKILGEEKGQKIDVFKFKAKSRYRRKIGFRPQYSRLLIENISLKK
jgi:large subunit ribosomal protein L21